MKRIILSFIGAFLAFGAMAQTFVSTTPANKNVVLEEYTGTNCTYCPDGHKRANEFAAANPGRVVLINIHQGSFAGSNPNYKTVWGDALANQTGLQGYPSGTINRRVFTGTATALNRGEWATDGAIVMNESSFVNVASVATIDTVTRIITVDVEVYYTGDANSKINMLNVALLQDSVLGSQVGASTYNPTQINSDGLYIHGHMLRHLFSNQFGDVLVGQGNVITSGTLFTKRYVYTLPENINNVPLVLKNLHIAAFVAKSSQEIYTGSLGEITLGEYQTQADPASLSATGFTGSATSANCSTTSTIDNLTFKVKNNSAATINSLTIKYARDNNDIQTFAYNTSINTGSTANIILPQVGLTNDGQNTTFYAFVSEIDGVNVETSNGVSYALSLTTPSAPKDAQGNVIFYLKTDNYGSEVTWSIKNTNGTTITSGGPYTDGASRYDTVSLNLPEVGCYIFEIKDSYGDGINAGNGTGNYKLIDNDGNILVSSNGTYTTSEKTSINLLTLIGLNDVENNISSITVYPNPVKDIATLDITLSESSTATIQVVDLMGRTVIDLGTKSFKAGQSSIELNTTNLLNGMYFVKINSNNGVATKKITVSK